MSGEYGERGNISQSSLSSYIRFHHFHNMGSSIVLLNNNSVVPFHAFRPYFLYRRVQSYQLSSVTFARDGFSWFQQFISRLCTKGDMVAIVTSATSTRPSVSTISLEVHTTFCVQIGGKSRIACERVVSREQSSVVRYEHFAR